MEIRLYTFSPWELNQKDILNSRAGQDFTDGEISWLIITGSREGRKARLLFLVKENT
jgi:hypothetical protein